MALIQCPECKQEMSDQAPACPHCGAPRKAAAPPVPTAPAGPAPAPRPRGRPLTVTVLVAIAVIVGIRFLRSGPAGAAPAPVARWIVDNVDANDSCSVLGEYCIRVRCAITNAGTVAGVAQVAAEVTEDSTTIGTRRGTRSVGAGQQDTLTLDFPEANMDKKQSFRCYLIQ